MSKNELTDLDLAEELESLKAKVEFMQCVNDCMDLIKEEIPHGSGINSDWHFSLTIESDDDGDWLKIRATNVYSAMDEWGGYCHDWPMEVRFSVFIPMIWSEDDFIKMDAIEVSLGQFYRGRPCACKWGLQDYLDETFWYFANEMNRKWQ